MKYMYTLQTNLKGNYRICTSQKVPNLVKGTRGEVKILISRKSCYYIQLYTIFSSFGIPSKRWPKMQNFLMNKNFDKIEALCVSMKVFRDIEI